MAQLVSVTIIITLFSPENLNFFLENLKFLYLLLQ